jgi:Protein of unknown function (DUF3800)
MVLQAFIDDSYTPNGTFVLAGHIASPEAWAKFSVEWRRLLRAGVITKDKRGCDTYHFKMSEMAINSERMERVPAFYWLIEQYVAVSISCCLNVSGLHRARSRLYVPKLAIDWGYMTNPYMVSYRCLMDMFHNHRQRIAEIIPVDQPVDFIFDEQTHEEKVIQRTWEAYIANRPDAIRQLYGRKPQFQNDQEFLPLQAADFWAWWVREWSEQGKPEKNNDFDFGAWRGTKPRPCLAFSFTEDQLFDEMRKYIRSQIEPARPIFDVSYSPLPSSVSPPHPFRSNLRTTSSS